MAKPELGTKRVCPSCGTKYYDLNRSPIICPNCGTVFVVAAPTARAIPAQRGRAPSSPAAVVAHEEIERDADVVSLDAVEEEAEPDVGPDADEDEAVIPEAEEIDAEIEAEDDDAAAPFLDEEEEEGDDVTGLLDVDAEDEDEV